MKERVACFIDGFNLYHAIHDLDRNHLKWVNLWRLMEFFLDPAEHQLMSVWYFSAFATWLPKPFVRHRRYVRALRSVGVVPVMGRFKVKDRSCRECGCNWEAHEEKESDVNIALWMLDGAYRDEFDRAHLVTGDSDLMPAVRLLRKRFPEKAVKVIAPPERRHGRDVAREATSLASIKRVHLERSLLPARIVDGSGRPVVIRPSDYDPSSA